MERVTFGIILRDKAQHRSRNTRNTLRDIAHVIKQQKSGWAGYIERKKR